MEEKKDVRQEIKELFERIRTKEKNESKTSEVHSLELKRFFLWGCFSGVIWTLIVVTVILFVMISDNVFSYVASDAITIGFFGETFIVPEGYVIEGFAYQVKKIGPDKELKKPYTANREIIISANGLCLIYPASFQEESSSDYDRFIRIRKFILDSNNF